MAGLVSILPFHGGRHSREDDHAVHGMVLPGLQQVVDWRNGESQDLNPSLSRSIGGLDYSLTPSSPMYL